MTISFDALRCFSAAAAHLNFRRAAASVNLSPQAFSARIQQLEAAVGAALFHRTTRRVSLTAAGARLQAHAGAIIALTDSCRAVVEGKSVAPAELTLGTRFELGLSWLCPAVQELSDMRPHTRIHLNFGDAPTLHERALSGVVDAVVTSSRIENIPVDYELLHEERYAFVGADQLLREQPVKRARDLQRHVLIDERRDLPLFRYLRDHRLNERWRFCHQRYLGTIEAIRRWVLAGRGLAVLPEYLIESDLRRGRLVRVLPRYKLASDRFRLVWRSGHPHESALRELAADLRQFPLC